MGYLSIWNKCSWKRVTWGGGGEEYVVVLYSAWELGTQDLVCKLKATELNSKGN